MVAEPGSHPRPHECLQQHKKKTKGNCGQPENAITTQTVVVGGGGRWRLLHGGGLIVLRWYTVISLPSAACPSLAGESENAQCPRLA